MATVERNEKQTKATIQTIILFSAFITNLLPPAISGTGEPASLGEGSYAKLIVKEILIHRLEPFVCRCNGAGFKLFCCDHGSAESGLVALLGGVLLNTHSNAATQPRT